MNRLNQENEKNIFLATTALEDFWDTDKPIVFLGDWCLRYSRRNVWEQLNGEVIQSIWKDQQSFHGAYLYVQGVYECILKQTASVLDEIHGERHDIRYWRIIIGPWLYHYIHILYDRYMCLMEVIARYPLFDTVVLSEVDHITPVSTDDFLNLATDLSTADPYNLQIYSRILGAMGRKFKKKSFNIRVEQKSTNSEDNVRILKRKFYRLLISLSNLIGGRKAIYLKDAYFSKYVTYLFYLKTSGMVRPLKENNMDFPNISRNMDMRLMFEKISINSNEFESILIKLLPFDVPYAFLENYRRIKKTTLLYPKKPRAIFSAVGWYFDEVFKIWAANSSESGSLLCGLQHGGNYGICKDIVDHEFLITDRFYSWGWRCFDFNDQIIPMPANIIVKMQEIKKRRVSKSTPPKDILFAGSTTSRYPHIFQYPGNNYYKKYCENQVRFFKSLSSECRGKIRVRPFRFDYGWDLLQRLKEEVGDLFIEGWNIPFQKSLIDCKLFVCDRLATIHAEALSLNIPTILFWDRESLFLTAEARKCLDNLHAVGILHYSPELAAKKVDEIYDDVDEWWNECERQSARLDFCDHYAKNSPNAIDEWINEFRKISR